MKKQMTCVICPVGCQLFVDDDVITGNKCNRGYEYAFQELTNPKRIVTTTVATTSNNKPRLSVKTDKPINKELVFEVIKELRKIEVNVSTSVGDIIIENIFNSGVNIVSTDEITL
ncbi:MAG: DUF1667 domain-containing protein [Tenericutes bacterium]|nr:DUF1667 domain-containing protein [Mycoplasmatota bacterium]